MRIVNRDMTKEKVVIHITNQQIYAEIYCKSHGKWQKDTYFQAYDWEISADMVASTINYITRTWSLRSPKIIIGE